MFLSPILSHVMLIVIMHSYLATKDDQPSGSSIKNTDSASDVTAIHEKFEDEITFDSNAVIL